MESQPLQLLPALEKRVDKHTWNLFKHFNKEFEIGDSVSMTEQETGSLLAFVYAHELLTETYGMNFLKGGLLNVMFCNSLSPDQTCTISAQVNKISEVSERTRTDLNILVRRQDNILAASGKATILIPSPIT